MNKRERIFSLIEGSNADSYVPAAFFLHFDPSCHRGDAAVSKHVEYFKHTGMDLLKIQYEHHFPRNPNIKKPSDWSMFQKLDRAFFSEPLEVVRGIVNRIKSEAPVIVTLYSPFMFAAQVTSRGLLKQQLDEDPDAVRKGIDTVVESVLEFVRGCIEAGVDGFYASTQGGEAGFLSDPSLFETYVKPTDLAVWDVIDDGCDMNILHVCDYEGPYTSLSPYLDYPGDIVNSALVLANNVMTSTEISELFDRPFMGGMDRHGPLATGPRTAIEDEANGVLSMRPKQFLLAADCTVPGDTSWDNIKTAVDCAHNTVGMA